jgi:hypothetical protein
MKRTAISLLLVCTSVIAAMGQAPATRAAGIGTFDKLSIVIAYYNSPQWKSVLAQKQQEKDAATRANDTAKLSELETWGNTQQDLAIQQLAGKAPIANILEVLQPAFREIEASQHLSNIVAYPAPNAPVATVDVTAQLLDWLHADAQTRQWISDAHPPAPAKP